MKEDERSMEVFRRSGHLSHCRYQCTAIHKHGHHEIQIFPLSFIGIFFVNMTVAIFSFLLLFDFSAATVKLVILSPFNPPIISSDERHTYTKTYSWCHLE